MTEKLPQYISVESVAKMLDVTERSVWHWSKTIPAFPKPIALSKRAVRWNVEEIKRYLELKRVEDAA